MKPRTKAILLACLHVIFLAGLGGKYAYDRMTRPRYWLKAAPVDPDLPIRGRYVDLRVELPLEGARLPSPFPRPKSWPELEGWPPRWQRTHLRVILESRNSGLVARAIEQAKDESTYLPRSNAQWPESNRLLPAEAWVAILDEPLAFYIPEHVPDPSIRKPGEELWVEATFPRKGPLRPIRLGVKKDGVITPL